MGNNVVIQKDLSTHDEHEEIEAGIGSHMGNDI